MKALLESLKFIVPILIQCKELISQVQEMIYPSWLLTLVSVIAIIKFFNKRSNKL